MIRHFGHETIVEGNRAITVIDIDHVYVEASISTAEMFNPIQGDTLSFDSIKHTFHKNMFETPNNFSSDLL